MSPAVSTTPSPMSTAMSVPGARSPSSATPEVNVSALGENAIILQVLLWIDAPRGKRSVRDDVYRRAVSRFAEAGIDIPFPQRVVRITEGAGPVDGP